MHVKSTTARRRHRIVLVADDEQLDEILCQIESTMSIGVAGYRCVATLNKAVGKALEDLHRTLGNSYDEESRQCAIHESVAALRLAPLYAQLIRHWPANRRHSRWGESSAPKFTPSVRRRLIAGLNAAGVDPVSIERQSVTCPNEFLGARANSSERSAE